MQSGFVKIKGSVTNLLGVDPKVVDSLFDLEVSDGSLQALQLDGLAVSKTTADDENLKVGQHMPVTFAQTGRQDFIVQAIYDQTAVTNYVISTAAYEKNFPDVFDAQIYLKTQGGPSPKNRAAIEKTMKAYPSGKVQDREQFKAAQSDQINQFLNLVNALAALRHRHRVVRHRQHARAFRSSSGRVSSGLMRAVGHDPSTSAVARALGGGDHRPARCVPRASSSGCCSRGRWSRR